MKSLNRPLSTVTLQWIASAVIATTALAWWGTAHAQATTAPATQTTAAQGVTVKVTPKPLAAGAAEWEFGVVLDTHSSSLDDDLVKTSVLVADSKELAPVGWSGAAAGGHHREGVLKFPAPGELPSQVELRIQRAGESDARVFRWDAASLR